MTGVGTVVAPVNTMIWPTTLSFCHCTLAIWVVPEVDLIGCGRHIRAPCRGVMHFMIAVRLLLGVDDEIWHYGCPLQDRGYAYKAHKP